MISRRRAFARSAHHFCVQPNKSYTQNHAGSNPAEGVIALIAKWIGIDLVNRQDHRGLLTRTQTLSRAQPAKPYTQQGLSGRRFDSCSPDFIGG